MKTFLATFLSVVLITAPLFAGQAPASGPQGGNPPREVRVPLAPAATPIVQSQSSQSPTIAALGRGILRHERRINIEISASIRNFDPDRHYLKFKVFAGNGEELTHTMHVDFHSLPSSEGPGAFGVTARLEGGWRLLRARRVIMFIVERGSNRVIDQKYERVTE